MFTKEGIKEACIRLYNSSKQNPGDFDTPARWDGIAGTLLQNPEELSAITGMSLERQRRTMAFLQEYDLPGINDEILDIGCGSGIFTAEFAGLAKKVTALDFSPVCLELTEERIREAGYRNVDIEACDMNTLDPEERGWVKKFDLVFSAFTPACYRYASIRKMETMSRKYCCLEMNLNGTFTPGTEIIRQVFGDDTLLTHYRLRSFQLLNVFLSLEGSLPSVRYHRASCSVPYRDGDAYLAGLLQKAGIPACSEEQLQKMRELIAQKTEEGVLMTRMEFLSGWILWDVSEKEICQPEAEKQKGHR